MSEPTTLDMSTDAVAARVRQALLDNDDWTGAWGSDCSDVIDNMVEDITAAVTGEQPDQPVDATPAPEPVLLRTFPVKPIRGGRVTTYRAQVEVQFQWIDITAVVASGEARPAEVRAYRVGNRLDVRIVADDGTVYAVVSRLLDGGW